MNIVTGYKGTPHISSNDQQGLNQGIFGTGNCVLNVGNKFSATLTDVNTVTISDGEGVMQGVHFRVEPGTTDTVNIENGTSGYNRIDLICARYTKNATTGVENVEWAVITGTPNASTASAPSYNTGDILNGDSPVDFPMFAVHLTGLVPSIEVLGTVHHVVDSVETLFELDSSTSVAAAGYYDKSFVIEEGVWIFDVSFRMTFASGDFGSNDYVSVLCSTATQEYKFGGTSITDFSGHGCFLYASNGSGGITLINGTTKTGTLESLTIKAINLV